MAGVVQSNIVSLRCPRRVARGRTLKLWYLDSSAITKLDRTERWSAELLAWSEALGRDERLVSSELAITEVVRAVRRAGGDAAEASRVVCDIDHLVVDRDLLIASGHLNPPGIRSLDAIHLAAALAFGEDLAGIVTYDNRMAEVARDRGLVVIAPGSGS